MDHPRLVIFDCDGVLVDSEPISIEILVDHIARAGGSIAPALAYEAFLGRSMATIRGILRDEYTIVFDDSQMEAVRADTRRRLAEELKPIPGIREALEGLDVPFCVASSSQPERIRLSLEVTGLLDLFEPNIYSASMVTNGKPAPDLFLHAAAQMGFAPDDCLVIEDSPAGIEAARRADMRVFGFAGGTHAGHGRLLEAFDRLQPDAIFEHMSELNGLIELKAAPQAH